MNKKLVIYTDGSRFVMSGNVTLGLHQGEIEREIDLDSTTDEEWNEIVGNPSSSLVDKFDTTLKKI